MLSKVLFFAFMQAFVAGNPLPLGLKNQTAEESEYLSFHICIGGGEAYGAAYLISKEHLLQQFTDLPLNWVNCELASFMMMTPKRSLKPNHNGQIIQSLDVLDFSSIHLSAYERLTRRNHYKKYYKKTPADTVEVMLRIGECSYAVCQHSLTP